MSGRSDEQQVGKAFELGAATTSSSRSRPRVAGAHRRHCARSARFQHDQPYRQGELTVDYLTHTVTVAGREVKLTPTEYKLLAGLCINAGRALSYEQLLELVWGDAEDGDAQRVRTFIKDLRAKLGDNARNATYILTVPNVGYRVPNP